MGQAQFLGEHLTEHSQNLNHVHLQQPTVFAESAKSLSSHKLYFESHSEKACLRVYNVELYQMLPKVNENHIYLGSIIHGQLYVFNN